MAQLHWITAAIIAVAGAAQAAPTTAFTVSGNVAAPVVYDLVSLQALPSISQTVSYRAGGIPVTDTFIGPTLWSVLQSAGGLATNPAIKNDALRKYIVATGSDGYKAVISAGEIAPNFGNKPDQIAIADSTGRLPNPDGFARVVAAGDVAGGRFVSNLADLHVGTAPAQPGSGGGPSTQVTVQGAVATSSTFTLPGLEAFTPHTQTVSYTAGGTAVTDTFTGALLWDVVNAAGILTDATIKNDIFRKLLTATGSDGYQVDFSLGEIDPAFGNAPILIAYADTAGPLGGTGFARIVVPGDRAGGRYVSNLESLTVFDPTEVPEPVSTGLFLLAAAGVAVVRRPRLLVSGSPAP